jgi:hypothetical protein
MNEYTIPDDSPHFPALLVYDDGTFTYLPGLETWKNDLDLWFWSSIKDYLVDCRGYRFEQAGERDIEGHSVQPASWFLAGRLTDEELILLVANKDGGIALAEWNRLAKTTPGESVAKVIFTLLKPQ